MRRLTTWFALALVTVTVGLFVMPLSVAAVQDEEFSPPVLSTTGSTQTTITVSVCGAVDTGAVAGFSTQWETETDYALFGWSDLVVSSASFSGIPIGSRFALDPGECTDVVIGDLDDTEIGLSFNDGSNDPLSCGTNYAFRAYAHSLPGGLRRSDFTLTSIFSTQACDDDADDDGVPDASDSCPATEPGAVVNAQGCAIAQLCPCDNAWKNHGAYVSCVSNTAEAFLAEGLISEAQKSALVSAAGPSSCGK